MSGRAGLHYRRGRVAIPYREYPYRYIRTPVYIGFYRLRLFVLCRVLGLHHWKLSSGWPGIPDRVVCKGCGIWMVQDDGSVLRGWSSTDGREHHQ